MHLMRSRQAWTWFAAFWIRFTATCRQCFLGPSSECWSGVDTCCVALLTRMVGKLCNAWIHAFSRNAEAPETPAGRGFRAHVLRPSLCPAARLHRDGREGRDMQTTEVFAGQVARGSVVAAIRQAARDRQHAIGFGQKGTYVKSERPITVAGRSPLKSSSRTRPW